jgi:GNAT superfamily N-acetyltransferase
MLATIRNAVVGDEGLLAELSAFVQDLHLERRPSDFKPTSVSELTAWYKSLLQTSAARAWIAVEDGLPIGYVLALVNRRPANPFCPEKQWWEIDQIAVDPRCRRRGVGRALISAAVAEAKVLGIQKIEAQSWAFNHEMHELLRRIGFVPKMLRFELKA